MSGYIHCACRDCFEITIGEPGEYCDECIEAGCPDYQGVEGMSQECQKTPPRQCPVCYGSGLEYDDTCIRCGGSGEVND